MASMKEDRFHASKTMILGLRASRVKIARTMALEVVAILIEDEYVLVMM